MSGFADGSEIKFDRAGYLELYRMHLTIPHLHYQLIKEIRQEYEAELASK